ncbi:MAG: sulfotransferase domain-containing protein [Thermodesulfovibrionales bacterium]
MTEPVGVVSGLPRSGTSLMMRLLEAGGLEAVTDMLRQADEDNPNGYYELERVKRVREDREWFSQAGGKVVKIVSLLLYELPPDLEYRIVFMKRSLDEICASQRVMLERMGEPSGSGEEEMGALYASHLREVEAWLAHQKNMEVLYVHYDDLVGSPDRNAEELNRFFGGRLSVDRMKGIVDASLHRQRRAHCPAAQHRSPVQQENGGGDQDREAIEERLRALGYM